MRIGDPWHPRVVLWGGYGRDTTQLGSTEDRALNGGDEAAFAAWLGVSPTTLLRLADNIRLAGRQGIPAAEVARRWGASDFRPPESGV